MNYKLIHNIENLNRFIELLPNLKENESYFLILIARKKWNPEANIPSAYKLKRECVTKEKITRTIRQWETEIGTYITNDGSSIPNENLGVYIAYNPKNQYKATFDLVKKCLESIEKGNKVINVKSMANDVIQSSNGSKNFIDIDVDIKEGEDYEDVVKFIKSVIDEQFLTFVKTNGGFHCLINLFSTILDVIPNSLSPAYGSKWYPTLQKHPFKSELNIMSNDQFLQALGYDLPNFLLQGKTLHECNLAIYE